MFEDVSDIISLPNTLTQNGLDYIAKQYQTIYDAFFGSENDNSEEPLVTPLILNGYAVGSANVYFWDSSVPVSYYACWFYDVHIYGDNMPETYFGVPSYDENFSNQRNSTVTGANREICVQAARNISNVFTVTGNSAFITPVTLGYHTESTPYIRHYTNFPLFYDENIFSITSGYRNYGTKQRIQISRKKLSDSDLNFLSYSDRFKCNILTEKQFFTNTVNDDFVNGVVNNNTYNQQTYTTNQGDTITYYYNDNSVIIPSSGGGGVGIGGVGGVALAYVDIESIFDSLLDDINLSIGGGSDLHFPSYDEIKYGDYGDFYIEPLHQFDKLPTAPQIDQQIDFGEYPSVLALTSQAFFDMLPVSLSALLAATLVLAVLIRNIGR